MINMTVPTIEQQPANLVEVPVTRVENAVPENVTSTPVMEYTQSSTASTVVNTKPETQINTTEIPTYQMTVGFPLQPSTDTVASEILKDLINNEPPRD